MALHQIKTQYQYREEEVNSRWSSARAILARRLERDLEPSLCELLADQGGTVTRSDRRTAVPAAEHRDRPQ